MSYFSICALEFLLCCLKCYIQNGDNYLYVRKFVYQSVENVFFIYFLTIGCFCSSGKFCFIYWQERHPYSFFLSDIVDKFINVTLIFRVLFRSKELSSKIEVINVRRISESCSQQMLCIVPVFTISISSVSVGLTKEA